MGITTATTSHCRRIAGNIRDEEPLNLGEY